MATYRKAEAEFSKKAQPDHDGPIDDWLKESDSFEQWRRLLVTQKLRFEANILGVDMPATSELGMYGQVEWDDDVEEPFYLTDAGIRAARDRIRVEKKHRREVAAFWVTSAVGVIGALTGLVSAFK